MRRVYIPFNFGFCVYPFIFLPKRVKGTDEEEPYSVHETTHLQRQKEQGVLKWLARYLFNKRFRLEEEKAAFRAEIEYKCTHGIPINREYYVTTLSSDYYGICSTSEAKTFVDRLLDEMKVS